ncbi:hypothetical protein [Chroococcidiopsis sp. SAG 2025]|uniref:hypothetical protein n=1 Tax=Chroococcidiopsis sp. SAG 2025 TaxID=171389 RepID=UPI002936E67A|nr:hypothetical protein [Chroococcidiopsis sp. SAG 2025]
MTNRDVVWKVQSVIVTLALESRNTEEQVKSYGDRISILGIWQPEQSFDYALVQGSFHKERYVKVMNAPCPKE